MKGVFVIGRVASGKSTYVKHIATDKDLVLELGSIARKVKGNSKRFFDNTLDDKIKDYCKKELVENFEKVYLVSSRSISLVETLSGLFDDVEYILLDTDDSICRYRFDNNKRFKDTDITYEEAIKGDKSIGMEDLIVWVKKQSKTTIIKNYEIRKY